MRITSRPPESVNAIVEDILATWSPSNLAFIRTQQHDFGIIGRVIRNDYGLWDPDHPLTKAWHSDPTSRVIRDGIDHSPNHPDNLSATILDELRRRLEG